MKALRIEEFGPLANLHVHDVPDPPLPAGCVRIAIEAAGVNPSDTGVALGRFPQVTLPRTLGRDFAGRVVEGPAGSIGTAVWGSGSGILGMTRDGAHAEHMILPEAAAVARPATLSAEEAAGAGVPFVTAWSALVDLAHFREGEWAVVSGAAGAVGSAAIALIAALGGNAIGVVLGRSDRAALNGLKLAGLLCSDLDDVANGVRELTGGRGADVALNAVGAVVFPALLDSLAHGGRMVIFSAREGREAQLDLFALYRRRLALFGLDTAAMSLEAVAALFGKFGPLFERGAIAPPKIAARYPLARAREAYERVGAGVSGKVVLIPDAAEAEAGSAEAGVSRTRRDGASPEAAA